jgi:hypothetical protein
MGAIMVNGTLTVCSPIASTTLWFNNYDCRCRAQPRSRAARTAGELDPTAEHYGRLVHPQRSPGPGGAQAMVPGDSGGPGRGVCVAMPRPGGDSSKRAAGE